MRIYILENKDQHKDDLHLMLVFLIFAFLKYDACICIHKLNYLNNYE